MWYRKEVLELFDVDNRRCASTGLVVNANGTELWLLGQYIVSLILFKRGPVLFGNRSEGWLALDVCQLIFSLGIVLSMLMGSIVDRFRQWIFGWLRGPERGEFGEIQFFADGDSVGEDVKSMLMPDVAFCQKLGNGVPGRILLNFRSNRRTSHHSAGDSSEKGQTVRASGLVFSTSAQ